VDSTIIFDVSPSDVSSSEHGTLDSASQSLFDSTVSQLTDAVNNGEYTSTLAEEAGSNSIFAAATVDPDLYTEPDTPTVAASTYNNGGPLSPTDTTTGSTSKISSMVGLAIGLGVGAVVVVAVPASIMLHRYMGRSRVHCRPLDSAPRVGLAVC